VTSAPAPPPLLSVEDLVAGYLPGVDILHGCTLTLGPREIVGIIGPNGAGKSTLLKAAFGLVPVRAGTVVLGGESIANLPAHELVERGIAYVPQRDNVFPSLTIEENLRMGAFRRPKDFQGRFAAVAELFPVLSKRRRQRAGDLSGGERQMVAMGRALMMAPEVLFLDEPSAGLSPLFQDQVFERVQEINRAGVAILMVEQNAQRCLEISDRGYVLDQGQNAYVGTGEQLLTDPKVVELYLGALTATKEP
jgi:branched-chain amino acid transport system ATP-binding protein